MAWIWSILFYLGLDPIKWAMAWAMNEDGFRTRTLNRRRQQPPPEVRPGTGGRCNSQGFRCAPARGVDVTYKGSGAPRHGG